MALRIRRGLEADRTLFTPDEGELLYATDSQLIYVGDGVTAGGILIGGAAIFSTAEGVPAFAGGGQGSATILTAAYNMIDTVASPGDSVKCSTSIAGAIKEIFNQGANDMDLYPAVGDRFKNGTTLMSINAPLSIGAGSGIKLVCYSAGVWRF